MAGFPTKFVESISCGVPVIATNSSDLADYIDSGCRNGYIVETQKFEEAMNDILNSKRDIPVDDELFDYRKYVKAAESFLHRIGAMV
jgi:glycosyltransferase involved in cell wall biosynthesis